jgi:hypothetical protein
MACTTISALFLFAMLGIVAIGALRSPAKANLPTKREEAPERRSFVDPTGAEAALAGRQ